ncbi:hypothetical protein NliqN6_5982 [Naganishia liquefaciens]|uniref:Uncharacterized protein n=1 Tax=Naganishia liquefaciens TaxID=104408 RepID=A0A8H3TZ83_9TREE|nr:hypothetical protein NliqN6_5982 [Naganishia liquefaciens]
MSDLSGITLGVGSSSMAPKIPSEITSKDTRCIMKTYDTFSMYNSTVSNDDECYIKLKKDARQVRCSDWYRHIWLGDYQHYIELLFFFADDNIFEANARHWIDISIKLKEQDSCQKVVNCEWHLNLPDTNDEAGPAVYAALFAQRLENGVRGKSLAEVAKFLDDLCTSSLSWQMLDDNLKIKQDW